MRKRTGSRRLHVATRPKVRRQRLRLLAACAAILALGGMAAITLRHLGRSLPAWPGMAGLLHSHIASAEVVGAPAELAAAMDDFLHGAGAEPDMSARIAALPGRFPCLRSVSVHRDRLRHSARITVSLRRAVGRVTRAGRAEGFLDADGQAFDAPPPLYPDARLEIEPADADAAQLRALAAVVEAWTRAELPSPLQRVRYRSAEGWELGLEDGTRILWGELKWTAEKLLRLNEALADARSRWPGVFTADLRYFEDGRVLLRPYS